ncbi:MAG: hypothetical protein J7L71_05480 [Spirochaetaceae bacterium]|nr:hypothetical protein [Spirochaetaceae bacterium]
MAIVSLNPTLLDLIKQLHDDEFLPIIDTLVEEFEALEDMVWVQANGLTTHTYLQTLNQPQGTWTGINDDVPDERAQFKELEEEIAMLEAYSSVDDRLVRISKNKQRLRSNQDGQFIAGLGKTFASAFINEFTDGKSFVGLRGRLNSLSKDMVYDGASTGDRTSLMFMQWGETKCHMIYPPEWKHGLAKEDLGKRLITSTAGKKQMWVSHYELAAGMCINNEKNYARIANINPAEDIETSGVDDLIITALNKMPGRGKGTIIYADTSLLTQFDIAVKDKVNVNLSIADAFGRPITTFLGHPIKLVDKIGITEEEVT